MRCPMLISPAGLLPFWHLSSTRLTCFLQVVQHNYFATAGDPQTWWCEVSQTQPTWKHCVCSHNFVLCPSALKSHLHWYLHLPPTPHCLFTFLVRRIFVCLTLCINSCPSLGNEHFPYVYLKPSFSLTSSHILCRLDISRSADHDSFHPRIREEQARTISGMLFWATSPKIRTIAEETWGLS